MFENPNKYQARNFTTNVPKILDLKSSYEQIFSENWRWVPLIEMAMESVRINGVSVLSGLHLEKLQELRTRKTVRNGEVSLLSTGVRKAGFDSTRNSTLTQSTSSLARAFP